VVVTTVGVVRVGGWAAVGYWFGVAPYGAGGVLEPVGRTSMMKGTVGARGVFLGAALEGVAKAIPVGTRGIAVCPRWSS